MPTIAGSLRSTANRVPEAEALLFGARTLTYRELDREVDSYAGALRDAGVGKGDRVCLMSGNTDLFVVAFYAVQRLGAVFVPVNPASAPPEVAHLVADSGATVCRRTVRQACSPSDPSRGSPISWQPQPERSRSRMTETSSSPTTP
jgi:fatty-acyl-CoA synthase